MNCPMQNLLKGRATRYAEEEGAIVHCPDAITLHEASRKCQISALAMVSWIKFAQRKAVYLHFIQIEVGDTLNHAYNIIEELVSNL